MNDREKLLAAGIALGAVALYGFTRGNPVTGAMFLDGLASAPFPDQSGPGAAVVVPPQFPSSGPVRVCVYVRGFLNCVENVLSATGVPCSPGGRAHPPSNLESQLVGSGSDTLLVLPELRREAQSGDPGRLSRGGSFAAFLDEVFARIAPAIGRSMTIADVGHLGLMSHSGGYQTIASIIRQRPAALRSVALLDSLYGNQPTFSDWITSNVRGFAPSGSFRFANLYTSTGGTGAKSRELASVVQGAFLSANMSDEFLFDDDASTPIDYSRHAIFKHVPESHDNTARLYPRRLWAAGW